MLHMLFVGKTMFGDRFESSKNPTCETNCATLGGSLLERTSSYLPGVGLEQTWLIFSIASFVSVPLIRKMAVK